MKQEQQMYEEIGKAFPGSEPGQMFGKPCFKIKGKAFICFFQDCMVFKLNDSAHRKAISLDGAHLFDPSAKGRPMKEWVQVPFDYKKNWKEFAKAALDYVTANA